MNICIVYEMNNREYNNCVLLERELIKRGHSVKICNKTEDINLFKTYDVTVIPNSYRTSDVNNYRYIFNTKNRLVIVYPCEQVTNHKLPDFFDYSDDNEVKKLPHLCWGEDYYNWIKSLGYDMHYARIVGALHLDFCRSSFKTFYLSRDEISTKYNLNPKKKWVLFISDFVLMNEKRYRQYIDAGAVDEHTLSVRRKFERKSKDEILKWFKRFIEENEGYQIIYRKHPVEILTDEMELMSRENENFRLIHDMNIKEWLFNCDVVTSWNSTSVVECYAGGISMGLLRPYSFAEEPMMNEYAFYEDFDAVSCYEDFVKCIIDNPSEYTTKTVSEIERFYCIDDTPAYIKMADAIEGIYNKQKLSSNERYYWVKRIFYLLRKHILFKCLVKKCYQFCYVYLGIHSKNAGKKKMAVAEWEASADNKKRKVELARKIDSILQ